MSPVWNPTVDEGQNAQARAGPDRWRVFLRGLVIEMEAQAGPVATTAVPAGRRATNGASDGVAAGQFDGSAGDRDERGSMAEIGWGSVRLTMNEAERCVELDHTGLPRIGSAGEPAGTWLAPVLEGLYQEWMGQQPGADELLRTRLQHCGNSIAIRYGRLSLIVRPEP